MDNCLILLTNYYPYYKGEEYLETEIKYLSKNFEHIYIISTMVSNTMIATRQVPNNVTVLASGSKHTMLGKIKMMSSKYLEIRKNKEVTKYIEDETEGNWIKKIYSYYFEARSMYIYERVEKLIKEYRLDQKYNITIYSYWFYVTARIAVELKNNLFKNINPYTVTRAHGYDININASPLKYLPHRKFLLNKLDFVFPCSLKGAHYLHDNYKEYKSKVNVRRLGTSSSINKMNISRQPLHIVSCSVIRKLKRLELIVDAIEILEKENMQVIWTHIGDGPEQKNIKKLVQKKLKKTQVNFKGFLSNQEVLKWYEDNSVTAFINVSLSEGVPVSIMEAMSKGIPIIATDAGGTSEIVEHGVNGYIIPVECSGELVAKSIAKIKSITSEEYIKFGENSMGIWEQKCNADRLYQEFAQELIRK